MRFLPVAVSIAVLTSGLILCDEGRLPDLNGTWKANLEKSEFAGTAPEAVVWEMKDGPYTLEVKQLERGPGGNEYRITLRLMKDGTEAVNKGEDGLEIRTVLGEDPQGYREDSTLIKPGQEKLTRTSLVTFSDDGKRMTVNSVYKGSRGDRRVKIVFEKQ